MQRNVSLTASQDTITPLDGPSPVPARHLKQIEISSPDSVSQTSPSKTLGIGHSDLGSNPASPKDSGGKRQRVPSTTSKSPFAFTPEQLSQLHDPKDLSVLRSMGGVAGLILGLQTDFDSGLSPAETTLIRRVTIENILRAIEEQQAKFNKTEEMDEDATLKNILYHHRTLDDIQARQSADAEHSPTSLRRRTLTFRLHSDAQIFHDRHRIFSVNRIPLRKPKNVFQLMWSVLQDKVLVQSR